MKRLFLVLALASLAAPALARGRAVRHPADPCSFSLAPAWGTAAVPAAGLTRIPVVVFSQPSTCVQWSAYSSAAWVTVEAAPLDAQPAAYVTVAPNDSPDSRTTTLIVAGVRLDVTQEGAPMIANPNNLVANGTFNTNIDGWIWYDGRFPNGRGEVSWSPLDANGSPASGSILLRDTGTGLAFQRLQCLTVNKSADYRFGVKVRTGQPRTRGDGTIALFTYASPDCTGEFTSNVTKLLSPAEPNVWESYEFTMRTGSRTESMIVVIASGASMPAFETWFDDIFVEPAS
jgi:hypothetical protein